MKTKPIERVALKSVRQLRQERMEEAKELMKRKRLGPSSLEKLTWKIRIHFLALAGFMFGLGCGERVPFMEWDEYVERDFGFSVQMPGTPIYSKTSLATQEGYLAVHQFQHKSVAFVYYVSVVEFPPSLMSRQSKRHTLRLMMEDQIHGMSGALESSEERSFMGFPSILFRARLPRDGAALRNDNFITSEIIIRGNAVYRVSAVGMGNEEETARFLESFRFL